MDKKKLLLNILLDKNALISDKDDAAMDLEEYDDDFVLETLIKVASDKDEDSMVLNTCGESIGSLWVKRNTFDKKIFDNLTKDAQHGILYVLRQDRPEWVKSFGIERKS